MKPISFALILLVTWSLGDALWERHRSDHDYPAQQSGHHVHIVYVSPYQAPLVFPHYVVPPSLDQHSAVTVGFQATEMR